MTMQNNIDISRRTIRRNMLQSKLQSAALKIDNQRPLNIAVAISAHDGDRWTNCAQLIENPLRANIAQMPNFVRIFRQSRQLLRELVVCVGEDKNSKNASHQSLKKAGTQEVEIQILFRFPAFLRNILVVILCVLCVRH